MDKKFDTDGWVNVIEEGKKFGSFSAVNRKDGKATIAIVYGTTGEERRANAQLISCSPEMFDLLERYMNLIDAGDLTNAMLLYSETKDLLTKATTI